MHACTCTCTQQSEAACLILFLFLPLPLPLPLSSLLRGKRAAHDTPHTARSRLPLSRSEPRLHASWQWWRVASNGGARHCRP
ncbi:hypothetical protein IWX49DRAFT_569854 [Phyllosticta citricarpa]